MFAQRKYAISPEKLDVGQFITLQESGNVPFTKLRCAMDVPYLKRGFDLDLLVWNLSPKELPLTERLIHYVLDNFSRLFDTAWTSLYYYLYEIDCKVAEHSLKDFFEEQINFDGANGSSIRLEINCDHLLDGEPRYCFVVATLYNDWIISEDSVRIYMIGNEACGINDNSDDSQMQAPLEESGLFYGMGLMLADGREKMARAHFQYAPPF